MNKILPLIVVVIVAAIAFVLLSGKPEGKKLTPAQVSDKAQAPASLDNQSSGGSINMTSDLPPEGGSLTIDTDDDLEGAEEKPAHEVYNNPEEALAAVRKGAEGYDDLILEQFAEIGDECAWCNDFFDALTDEMKRAETDEDTRSYYSELLAVSGKTENIKTLIDAINSSEDEELASIYAESLEIAIGNDNLVSYLKDQLSTDNELLKESVVAAITNHGSIMAAEALYNQALQSGDPDGYYSVGIGLGEMIPDQEAFPYLEEMVLKRDKYSHLAAKALANSGDDGLRIVFESLSSSPSEIDQSIVKDFPDHVSNEEHTMEIVNKYKDSSNQVVKDTAEAILKELNLDISE